MKLAVFVNGLGLGGTEKAACRWARGLVERGHKVAFLALRDGPRRAELKNAGIDAEIVESTPQTIARSLERINPDVIHAHAPGHPHDGDILGDALVTLPKIPVVQTNIFGKFDNPREDQWTDFRLFISWTSCVQAARRSLRPLNAEFFRRASVAVYPVDADEGPGAEKVAEFRGQHGVGSNEVLFGRLSRPEPNKWTELPVESFRRALLTNERIKLLLREPPPEVSRRLQNAPDRERFVILPATSDAAELRCTMASLDVVLHTSSIGESFGYGIAEPMNLGKPVIANSTPWGDLAQIELVRYGECGFIASTPRTMSKAILAMATDPTLRFGFGSNARRHIRELADPMESMERLERILYVAIAGGENPRITDDLAKARPAEAYLNAQQFGHSWRDQCALRPFHYWARFHQWRKACLRQRSQ